MFVAAFRLKVSCQRANELVRSDETVVRAGSKTIANDLFEAQGPVRKHVILAQPLRHLFDDERPFIGVYESAVAWRLSVQTAGCDQQETAGQATSDRRPKGRSPHT